MTGSPTVSQLVKAAALEHLASLGLRQRAGSSLWFDDRGWWLINVEFQPSRRQGTYLNVGAMWLWNDRDHWAFDDGSRVYWRADGSFTSEIPFGERGWTDFLDYRTPEQFTNDLGRVARVAAQQVQQLREQFPDPRAAANQLTSRSTRPAESNLWHLFNSAAAAGLSGDTQTARRLLDTITVDSLEPDWAHELAGRSAELSNLTDNALRNRLIETIEATRQRLKLPTTPLHLSSPDAA